VAWIPAAYLERQGDTARLIRQYDSTELDADPGDQVTVLAEESGWAWCKKPDGRLGWLPLKTLCPQQGR
jgi:hypothetical protein